MTPGLNSYYYYEYQASIIFIVNYPKVLTSLGVLGPTYKPNGILH